MRRVLWILAAAIAVALPFLVPKSFYLQIIASAYITAIAVYGLNVILGYTGLLNLGHAAFFGIGAYAVALLQTKAGWPFWPALLAGCAASVLFGALVGMISLRTRGNYFAIFTAAVGVMIAIVFTNWQDLTGGNIGIVNIPPPPPIGPLTFDGDVPKYYLVLAALALTILICVLVRNSLIGRTFVAIADNEDLARATGVNVARVRLTAFMLSTFLAGLAGGMFAMYNGNLGPDQTGLDITFEQLLFLVIGGIGTIAGPLVGTLVLVEISQQLQGVQQYRFLIFGPMLVLLVRFFPMGIVGGFNRLTARWVRP
ncbi:MAG: branched-chain amino acid transporter permease [Candidatus Eremiobacteraeota bacterium]|nr:branched-chain amino acid transporter permease [Candidatus Eremiobacteraeota bacterium]